MTTRHFIITGVVVMALATGLRAQTTTTSKEDAGAAQYTVIQMIGEVVTVEGNRLLARMRPSGAYHYFNVQPGRQFSIDGQTKLVGDLAPGTILTATVVVKTQPVTVRTMTVTNGTVWYVSGNYVIVTLESGENREFTVPETYRFTVNGKPASVHELRKGMRVSGTKVVAEPETEMSSLTVVTGTAPK